MTSPNPMAPPMQRLILLLSLIYASGPLYASDQIRYISDSFFVPLRVGPSNSHRIVHRGLKSGTQVTLLNIDKDKKFSQVRLGDGQTGWLPNRTLQAQPSAASQMAQLTEQLNLTQPNSTTAGQCTTTTGPAPQLKPHQPTTTTTTTPEPTTRHGPRAATHRQPGPTATSTTATKTKKPARARPLAQVRCQ